MVEEPESLLYPSFEKVNRTRCFLHLLNLVAKSMLKVFELAENDVGFDGDTDPPSVINMDEEIAAQRERRMRLDDDEMDDDDSEEWVDTYQMSLTESEKFDLRDNILPVTRILVKVSELRVYWLLLKPLPSCADYLSR